MKGDTHCCCVSQCHARYRYRSAEESDPADNVDDADTQNATTSTAESVAAPSDTSDCCCEVCLLRPREGVALT